MTKYRMYWKTGKKLHSCRPKTYKDLINKIKSTKFDEIWFYFYYDDGTENKSIKYKTKKEALWVAKSFHEE